MGSLTDSFERLITDLLIPFCSDPMIMARGTFKSTSYMFFSDFSDAEIIEIFMDCK